MNAIHTAALLVHAVAGTIGLLAFWLAALSRKGGRTHIAAGRAFHGATWSTATSAAALSFLALLGPGDPARSLFFLHVAVLALAPAVHGRGFRREARRLDAALQVLLMAGGAGALGLAIARGRPEWATLGAVGVLLGARSLQQLAGGARLERHVLGMISAGIALHTAALVIAVGRLLPGGAPWFAWVAPGILGGAVIAFIVPRLRGRAA